MLTRFRIEVEEQTVAECVEALAKYEHALCSLEADRWRDQWPVELVANEILDGETVVGHQFPHEKDIINEQYPVDCDWDMEMSDRQFYTEELGAEVTEELIEYDASIPGYKGRRVVRLTRVDMRNDTFLAIKPYVGWQISAVGAAIDTSQNSGTNP